MRILFDHIPKTGGTSLQVFFSEAFGAEKVTPVLRSIKLSTALKLYKNHHVIIGHFDFIPGESLPEGFVTVTVVRNPLQRTLSEYFYQIYDVPEHQLSSIQLKTKQIPLEEAFFEPEICKYFANYQARHFASFQNPTPENLPADELLRLAKSGLEKYDLVATTEKLYDFCEELKRIFKLSNSVLLKRVNVTSKKREYQELPVEIQKRLLEINSVDMELWDYANYLFNNKTKFFILPEKPNEKIFKTEYTLPASSESSEIETGIIELIDAVVVNRTRPGQGFLAGEEAMLSITFRCNQDIDELTIGYSLHHDSGLHLFGINTRIMGYKLQCKAGLEYTINFLFTLNLGIGRYFVNVTAHTGLTHLEQCYFWKERVTSFDVDGYLGANFEGLVRLIPICKLDNKIEAVSDNELDHKIKKICINNPPLSEVKGSIHLLSKSVPPVKQGEQFSVMVEINNLGDEAWVCEGIRPVYLSYHWRDLDNNIVVHDGIRTPLPGRILRGGETMQAAVLIEAPKQTGRFILELTLVQEMVCWFEERGFDTAKIEVVVTDLY